jgi:hypothetical protein
MLGSLTLMTVLLLEYPARSLTFFFILLRRKNKVYNERVSNLDSPDRGVYCDRLIGGPMQDSLIEYLAKLVILFFILPRKINLPYNER